MEDTSLSDFVGEESEPSTVASAGEEAAGEAGDREVTVVEDGRGEGMASDGDGDGDDEDHDDAGGDVASESPDDNESTVDASAGLRVEAEVTPTYEWSPAGAACTDCGKTVTRRWRDETGVVCADCKDW